jgi:hypothetical protein
MFLLDSTDLSLMRLAVSISRLKKTYFISFFAVFIGASTQTFASNEVPQSFTLDGQLSTLTGDQPLLDNHAKITVQILDPSKTCLLYEESQFVDTTISNGYYSVQIGSVLGSSKRTSSDPGRTMQEIFQNRNSINASNSSSGVCGGGAYSPSPGASRYFRLIVTPSATNVADTLLPDTIMDSVPYSLVAESVQGLTPNNLLQVKTTGGSALSQANLENVFSSSNHVNLLALLAIPAANVLATPANGGAALPSYAGNPSSPAAGHIWYDSGSNVMKYYDGAIKTIGTSSGLSSVGLSMPGIFSVSGTPLTANGSITTTLANQSANTVFAGPASGGAAAPTFRSLASTDLPLTGASGMYTNGGNSFGVAGSLGTNDAYDLNFKTNNTTKMTILSNGSVGIGTATPTTMLSVAANSTLQTPNTGSLLQLTGANNSSGALTIDTFGSATSWDAPYLTLRRSRGTSAAPAYPVLNDVLGELQMFGWDGGPFSAGSQISSVANENWSATARGTSLHFRVGTFGAAGSTHVATMNSSGVALFGANPSSKLRIGGTRSGTSWTTSGALFCTDPGTLTDTTGSGAITTRVANSFDIPTFASTNPVTITNAATLYVAGPPAAGANTTLTNRNALYVAGGTSYFGGNVGLGTTSPSAPLDVRKAAPGTISSSGATVTGVGTSFLSTFQVGDSIYSYGQVRTISAVSSDTSLTTTLAFNPAPSTLPYTRTQAKIFGTLELEGFGPSANGGSPVGHDLLILKNTDVLAWNVGSAIKFEGSNGNLAGRLLSSGNGGGSNYDLVLQTSGAQSAMVFRHDGSVGIGSGLLNAGFDIRNQSVWPTAGVSIGTRAKQNIIARANNDVLNAFEIDPTFTDGIYTGVTHNGLIVRSGNVGIGTTTPTHQLDVKNSVGNYALRAQGTLGSGIVLGDYSATFGGMWNGSVVPSSANYALLAGSDGRVFLNGTNSINFNINDINKVRINSLGNMGIGTQSPEATLDVVNAGTTTSAIIVPRAGNFTGTNVNGMIRYNTSSTLFEFYQNGAWVNYTAVSDGRLKTNVVPVTDALGIVNQLNPVFYDWDRSHSKASGFEDKHQVGFIAQEVEKVLPEVVNKGEDSYRSLEYGKIVSVVVAAVKELYSKVLGIDRELASVKAEKADKTEVDAKVQKLEYDIDAKDKRIKELEQRLENIEKALNAIPR